MYNNNYKNTVFLIIVLPYNNINDVIINILNFNYEYSNIIDFFR